VTLTLQHGKVNALCVELLNEIAGAAMDIRSDDGVRAVVITGGDRIFAAGADITEFAENPDPDAFVIASPERVRSVGRAFLDAFEAVESIPVPTIASIAGFALGGGCELALACDMRIASTKAKLGQPEILLGIIPGGGGTQRLARLVGPSIAKDLIFTGRQVGAEEALRIGLVNEVVEPEELAGRVDSLANQLADGARDALVLAKLAIDHGLDLPLGDGLRLEQQRFVDSFAALDATVGVSSFLRSGPGVAVFRHSADS
jgi:enoyl-CoA hydratase